MELSSQGIKHQLDVQNHRLAKLQQEKQVHERHLAQQRLLLAKQIRDAHWLSGHHYLQLLLSLQNPHAVSRQLSYYEYLNRARLLQIREVDQILAKLQGNEHEILTQRQRLETLHNQYDAQRQRLKAQLKHRQTVLNALNSTIQTQDQQLAELKSNKKELEKIIKHLKRQQWAKFKINKPMGKYRGKLNWPTKGIIIQHYGTHIEKSQLQYNGVLISAPEGEEVRAIYPGQVIFADWLKGFGLLLIIDHGHGYMTLYAHNHSLFKKAGDRVEIGENIASIGHSGGNHQNGLYFELRYDGKPENPERWLTS